MGRTIYFKKKEIEALKNVVWNYIGKIEDAGEEGVEIAQLLEQEFENGLNDAMAKLSKGTREECIWKKEDKKERTNI